MANKHIKSSPFISLFVIILVAPSFALATPSDGSRHISEIGRMVQLGAVEYARILATSETSTSPGSIRLEYCAPTARSSIALELESACQRGQAGEFLTQNGVPTEEAEFFCALAQFRLGYYEGTQFTHHQRNYEHAYPFANWTYECSPFSSHILPRRQGIEGFIHQQIRINSGNEILLRNSETFIPQLLLLSLSQGIATLAQRQSLASTARTTTIHSPSTGTRLRQFLQIAAVSSGIHYVLGQDTQLPLEPSDNTGTTGRLLPANMIRRARRFSPRLYGVRASILSLVQSSLRANQSATPETAAPIILCSNPIASELLRLAAAFREPENQITHRRWTVGLARIFEETLQLIYTPMNDLMAGAPIRRLIELWQSSDRRAPLPGGVITDASIDDATSP